MQLPWKLSRQREPSLSRSKAKHFADTLHKRNTYNTRERGCPQPTNQLEANAMSIFQWVWRSGCLIAAIWLNVTVANAEVISVKYGPASLDISRA